jgi:eukaryotic-like serine/threonine-protein kinase
MVSGSHLVGSQVGQYEVKQVLGMGGMGTVYEGLHPLIHKRVAIKVLHPHFSRDAGMVSRFLSEAKAVNAIGHRGIIDIFAFGELPAGHHYFVMELLEGRSLEQVLRAEGPLPVDRVLDWADEILDALSAAHETGVVHRDLKPSNLFLVEPPHGRRFIKVLDFGIAKLLTHGPDSPQHTRTGLVGTPSHISPEQVTGAEITHAADLYAFGCVLFELLTGRPPFSAESALGVMGKHVSELPPLASELRSALPPELDAIIAELLAKQPGDRPASAEAVRVALGNLRPHVGSGTPSPSLTRIAVVLPDGPRPEPKPLEPSDASLAPLEVTPLPPRAVAETRVAPADPDPGLPRAVEPATKKVAEPTEPSGAPLPIPSPAPAPGPRSQGRAFLVGGVLVCAALLALVVNEKRKQDHRATAVVEIPVPPPPTPEPLPPPEPSPPPEPPEQSPATTGEPPSVARSNTGKGKPVAPRGPTLAQLESRLSAFEKKLGAHEKEKGDRDALLRNLLGRVRDEARSAKTPRALADAEKRVASLEQQLR